MQLMIQELRIKNFRLFKDLEIKDLKRVNLFAGKNNSGKSALLEALRIMAAGREISVLRYILEQRGEDIFNYLNLYESYFYRPELEAKRNLEKTSINFIINNFRFQREFLGDRNIKYYIVDELGKIDINQLPNNLPNPIFPRDNVVFVPFNTREYFPLSFFWDQIALTPKEDKVVEIIRDTILPKLIRIDVQQNERIMVRLEGMDRPLPLKNLGDGVQRILILAMALVSATNNVLLIDEIETGLHYSVLDKIWEIIFKYSAELNVQVFATTHSQDAIKAFMYLLEKQEYKEHGLYFRLQYNTKNEQVEAIRYAPETLELSLESNLDPR